MAYCKNIILIILITGLSKETHGQEIHNLTEINSHINSSETNLFIIGEQHTSAANPKVVFELLTYLNRSLNLKTFLIEFGPSEAYLYNLYLQSGDQKYLKHTTYGSNFKEWQTFWGNLYEYNQILPSEKRIKVKGIDFERMQPFTYAFLQMMEKRTFQQPLLDSLVHLMQSKKFQEQLSNRFPTKDDKRFFKEVGSLLSQYQDTLNHFGVEEANFIESTLINRAVGFAGKREMGLRKNISDELLSNPDESYLLLIGEGHADYSAKNVAFLLKENTEANILSGKILYQDSWLWNHSFSKKLEVSEFEKSPWKKIKKLKQDISHPFTFLDLAPYDKLSKYFDFIIVAKGGKGLTF